MTNVIDAHARASVVKIPSGETQNVTNGIALRSTEKKTGFLSLSHDHNPVCHVHSEEWKPPRRPLVDAAEDFDPQAAARALLPVAHYKAWRHFNALIPLRMRDGSKLPPGLWRAMKDELAAAHEALRREHFPQQFRNRDA